MDDESRADRQAGSDYWALPLGGSGPGVLVLHAWWGLTDMVRETCDRIAACGYVALAPDLYEGKTAATVADAERLMAGSDTARMQSLAIAALADLRNQPNVHGGPVSLIGFSMGAAWALVLSSLHPADVGAVVTFYGTTEGGDYRLARASYLGHYASDDPYEPLAAVQALEEQISTAGRDVVFHMYPGTTHWFCESDRADAYNADAARLAWERTIAFLRHHSGSHSITPRGQWQHT